VLVALLCAAGPAAARDAEVMAVQAHNEAPTDRRMRVFWKRGIGEENDLSLLDSKSRNVALPGKFYVGTELRNGRNSLHFWEFRSGFVREAGVKTGLRLALKADPNDCFASRQIEQRGKAYDSRSSTADLLSAAILFGHLHEVCLSKQNKPSADAASAQVRRFYGILAGRMPRSFSGRMCQGSGAC